MGQPLQDCKKVFLDTGVLLYLVKSDYSRSNEKEVKIGHHVKMVFNTLNSARNPSYYVSAISLAEIHTKDRLTPDTIRSIMTALDSTNLEIVAFDESIAERHNSHLEAFLGRKKVKELSTLLTDTSTPIVGTKELIRKDYLIIATALELAPDIIFTTDERFSVLCTEIGARCHWFNGDDSVYLFNQGDDKIYDLR